MAVQEAIIEEQNKGQRSAIIQKEADARSVSEAMTTAITRQAGSEAEAKRRKTSREAEEARRSSTKEDERARWARQNADQSASQAREDAADAMQIRL